MIVRMMQIMTTASITRATANMKWVGIHKRSFLQTSVTDDKLSISCTALLVGLVGPACVGEDNIHVGGVILAVKIDIVIVGEFIEP